MEREHNEVLAKLNFVVALCECVCEVARSRAGPLGNIEQPAPLGSIEQAGNAATRKRAEQVILLVRALQWLSSGLNLATQELKAGRLQPTATVKEGKFPLYCNTYISLLDSYFSNKSFLSKSLKSHHRRSSFIFNIR